MSSTPTDPLVQLAWHLRNTGQTYTDGGGTVAGVPGIDLRVDEAWGRGYSGEGIKVAVSDDGVEAAQPDLAANINFGLGVDLADNRTGGLPVDADDGHGTEVAGVIAAVADNGIGSAGVAYDATIVSVRHGQNDAHDLKDDAIGQELVKAFDYQLRTGVDISNNSWGPDQPTAVDAELQAAIQRFATAGRDGLGGVVMFAAGNERAQTLSANLEGDENSPYAIPVASVDQTGKFSVFSSPGANILVAAPGENIQTTARVGTGDDHGNYTLADGTSFATPNVAGVAALVLQANPALTALDVQRILALTAHAPEQSTSYLHSLAEAQAARTDAEYTKWFLQTGELQKLVTPWDWQTNGATDWNGGGMHASHDYGFGLVDAGAAVRLAESWTPAASPAFDALEAQGTGNAAGGIAVTVGQDAGFTVEKATLTIELTGFDPQSENEALQVFDHLDIRLISPSGTVSYLVYGFDSAQFTAIAQREQAQDGDGAAAGAADAGDDSDDDNSLTLTTTQHWGEDASGVWTIQAVDSQTGQPLQIGSWSLDLLGQEGRTDDSYVYTSEYATLAAHDLARQVLVDRNGGQDTVNFAAVTAKVDVSLSGTDGTIGGTPWKVGAGIHVEHAVGGTDGDAIVGSDAANWLRGMSGDDLLNGGLGNDRLDGGTGADQLIGLAGDDRVFGGSGADRLDGGDGADLLSGDHGDDLILGGSGDDLLFGYAGADRIEGGAGDDRLDGGKGDDALLGQAGDDTIVLGTGQDVIDGGEGTDTLAVLFSSEHFRVEGTATSGRLVDLGGTPYEFGAKAFSSVELIEFSDRTLGWNGGSWQPAAG